MTLTGLNDIAYTTGREVGRGGEGAVYELQSHYGFVVKLYTEPLTEEKTDKLRHMVGMRTPTLESYAAWPTDLVKQNGAIVGFVMKKLQGYVPLHMIFSPMDRKKMFPDKGYHFLAHVARNLATAFYKLHEAGLVVGDVNEGNILISSTGLVAFIDCDSFQVKGDDHYYCEVGVPRYTPPELLEAGTFTNVLRSVNTDSFSLAVLIFQLLFLGRHPFAGKNRTAADIDEETAIRNREFAYSLTNKKKRLMPPNDSFDITNLAEPLVELFHRAFETDQRPTPIEWIRELDGQLANIITCGESKIHTYPAQIKECPWCYFKKKRGILYFLDDSYIQATAALGDMDSFVNGFRVERLELKKWNGQHTFSALFPVQPAAEFRRYKSKINSATATVAVLGLLLAWLNLVAIPIAAVLIWFFQRHSPWKKNILAELHRKDMEHLYMRQKLNVAIREYDEPKDLEVYNKCLQTLQKLVFDFRNLPIELEQMRKNEEERLYNEQLHHYLNLFPLADYTIPSVGPARKTALLAQGITTAADINKLQSIKAPGIGPKNMQMLQSWQRQMASGFVYVPDNAAIAAAQQKVNADITIVKANLENAIRKEYQSLNYIKHTISNRSALLERQINDLSQKTYQAQIDLDAFRKFAA